MCHARLVKNALIGAARLSCPSTEGYKL